MPLPPHPLATVKAYAKLFTERDRLAEAPLEPIPEEAAILVEQAVYYSGHSNKGLGGSSWDYRRLAKRQPLERLIATRCQWFGWLAGHTWEGVGGVKPEGEIVLVRYLLEREAAGDAALTKLRHTHYRSDWEEKRFWENLNRAEEARKARDRASEQRRHTIFDAADAHRARTNAAKATLMQIARDLGAGRINDLEGALERLREAEKALQAEEAWTNPMSHLDDEEA